MELLDREMWETNIDNVSALVADEFGNEMVAAAFARYGACNLSNLSHVHFSEVFADLMQLANDI